jgi:hypothetical protein
MSPRRGGAMLGLATGAAVLAVALAACGGSSTNSSAGISATQTGETTYKPPPPPKDMSYDVTLGTFKRGAPGASATAIVSIKAATSELCWTISELHGVSHPTEARLFRKVIGGTGAGGYKLGHGYKSSGCIPIESVVLGLIESKPEQFFVSVHAPHYPAGAVRGPLL